MSHEHHRTNLVALSVVGLIGLSLIVLQADAR
jgi:hypothetical protein